MQRLVLGTPVLDGMWFYTLAGLFYFYLRLKYGFCNFDDTDTTGPFRVGYSALKGEGGNQCAVFYPIDREEGEKTGKGMFPKLVRSPGAWLDASTENALFVLKAKLNHVLFLPYLDVKIPACIDADLAPCFVPEKEGDQPARKLVPLVFSHGMLMDGHFHSLICRELASYGLMVVTLDHMDGSCNYTENCQTGEPVKFSQAAPVDSLEGKHYQMRERQL